MDEAPISNKDIVMLGNSLTENGGNWAARLGNKHVRNRGIIGDEVMGVYDRLHQILPGHPAKLFLLIGVNDISHGLTSDSIVSMIRTTGRTHSEGISRHQTLPAKPASHQREFRPL